MNDEKGTSTVTEWLEKEKHFLDLVMETLRRYTVFVREHLSDVPKDVPHEQHCFVGTMYPHSAYLGVCYEVLDSLLGTTELELTKEHIDKFWVFAVDNASSSSIRDQAFQFLESSRNQKHAV